MVGGLISAERGLISAEKGLVLERNRELGYDRDEQNDIVLSLERNLLLLSLKSNPYGITV